MMPNDLISVIVPVYNVEQYVERCVKTLMEQTYSNYEILLIDDGSTDSSGKICDELASNEERISVYHKENGGLGSARNYGIERAKGKYVCFVDSDDTVSRDYLTKLEMGIRSTDSDIAICGYVYQTGEKKYLYTNNKRVIEVDDVVKEMAKGNPIYNFAWNKLYKMSIISQMDMLFEDRHCAEDMYFNCYYYRLIDKACIIPDELYTYYVNKVSLSNGRRKNFYEDMKLVYKAFRDTCEERAIDTEYADALLVVLLRNSISNYFNVKRIHYREYVEYLTEMHKDTFDIINSCSIELSSVDKTFYKLFLGKKFFSIFAIMKCAKFLKENMSYFFSRIRRSLS